MLHLSITITETNLITIGKQSDVLETINPTGGYQYIPILPRSRTRVDQKTRLIYSISVMGRYLLTYPYPMKLERLPE